jgi:hypothetical protein
MADCAYSFRDRWLKLREQEANSREACGTGVLQVCFELSITIWVTPGNGLTKLLLCGLSVLQQHFRGLQMVFLQAIS